MNLMITELLNMITEIQYIMRFPISCFEISSKKEQNIFYILCNLLLIRIIFISLLKTIYLHIK